MLNCYLNHQAHHNDERDEFIPYDHMRVRTKVRISKYAYDIKCKKQIWIFKILFMSIFILDYFFIICYFQKFPWGDGNHSLFHNPKTNPLPEGYED